MLVIENPQQLSIANDAALKHHSKPQDYQASAVRRSLSDSQLRILSQNLYRRHARQILGRRLKDRRAADHLVACAYIPADGALTFENPIIPVDSLILLVVHWQAVKSRAGTRFACRLRGYTSWFASHRAISFWDTQRFSFAVDFSHPHCWKALDRAFPSHGFAAARIAMDMEREIHRLAPHINGIDATPKLPLTLMAIPRSADIAAEATPAVVDHAAKSGMSWRAAWEELHDLWQVPDKFNPLASSCRLIDTRICTRAQCGDGWPGKVGLFFDLRGLIGRAVPNPFTRMARGEPLPTPSLIDLARDRMSPDVALGCSDQLLLTGLANPRLPLSVPGLASINIWSPTPHGPRADAFRFRSATEDADLWTIAECA